MAEFAGLDGNDAAGAEAAAVEERGEAGTRMEAAESEDEEDVFEVESILDAKIEGGKVFYQVRWKGYDSSGDTWEPEAHLEDCKEVLLEFRRKQAESKQKAAKKESPPKLSPGDLFDAESDSDSKEETPQKKKKKSNREEDDDKLQEELKNKKSKSGKSKEKPKHEGEAESQSTESKPKKRLSESKEDLGSKKPKKDDNKDSKKSKKEETKDTKLKVKEDPKEKKPKKSLELELSKEETLPVEPEAETVSVTSDVLSEDRDKVGQDEDLSIPEATPPYEAEELSFGGPFEEEMDEAKLKKKKKKHKKKNDSKPMLVDLGQQDKKSLVKKQKSGEKLKEALAAESMPVPVPAPAPVPVPVPVPVPKRPSTDDKVKKSVDSLVENKETKKAELVKERPKKKHEPEKEAKKEIKVLKSNRTFRCEWALGLSCVKLEVKPHIFPLLL